MELSVSCVSVVMLFVFVHDITPHRSEITVPRIVPSKLQLFDYASLKVNCEGFFNHTTQWRIVRNKNGQTMPCNKNSSRSGPCHIPLVFTADSGEYWCESRDPQRRSESVHITVTDGGVVLESPVRPVMVGDDVTLRCIVKNKTASSFYFYKDGTKLNSSPTGEMTIHNISESDQGLYRCSTSDGESSGENLLRVRAVLLQCPHRPVTEGTYVTLICTDKMAAPKHTALFFKDGETIGSSSSGELTLKVSKSDEGVYKCRSSEGRESEEQWLAVRAGGAVLESPARPVMVGDDVTLCCVERKDKKPASEFYFYKDGAEVNTSPTGEMTIHNISESDQGLYRCSTSDGESSGENLLSVRAVLLQCPHRPVTEGTYLTLICTDKMAAPKHTALFFKDGETIGSSSSGKLTLKVSKSDEGVYKCRSSEGRESEEQWLAVRAGGAVLESPARPVMVGDDVTLRCVERKDKKPASEFYFYKDGAEVNTSPTGEMTIHNISESDQGLYRCSTSDGESSGENLLSVRAVLLQCPHRPVTEGTNVTLICTDKMAAPNHTALFFKDGETIGSSSSGKLTLKVSKSDEGVYKCRSSEGRESEEQWLAVRGGSVTSVGDVSDEPQPTVSPLVGLVALPLLLLVLGFIYKRHKDPVSSRAETETETETAVYSIVTRPKNNKSDEETAETTISDGEKPELCCFSRRGRGPALVDMTDWELYTTAIYSEKSKDV